MSFSSSSSPEEESDEEDEEDEEELEDELEDESPSNLSPIFDKRPFFFFLSFFFPPLDFFSLFTPAESVAPTSMFASMATLV